MAATQVERLGIVETRVQNLGEKVDELKVEVRENHETIKDQLDQMAVSSSNQHAALAKKIDGLEQAKNKITWMVAGGIAVSGILAGHLDKLLAFFK